MGHYPEALRAACMKIMSQLTGHPKMKGHPLSLPYRISLASGAVN